VAELRSHAFREGKAALLEALPRVARHRRRGAALRGLTRHVDATCAAVGRPAMPAGATLVAWAATAAASCSPIPTSTCWCCCRNAPPTTRPRARQVEGFMHACWDIGLEIGSSVRTVDECVDEARRDVTVQTALLEARFICGARRGFTRIPPATDAALDPKAFLRAKMLEMQQRHVKYEGTPYALEPNCKESPGGLRDLQVVIWVARAAGLGRTWTELAPRA
jgi:[protein-PII] uridylyltransferase